MGIQPQCGSSSPSPWKISLTMDEKDDDGERKCETQGTNRSLQFFRDKLWLFRRHISRPAVISVTGSGTVRRPCCSNHSDAVVTDICQLASVSRRQSPPVEVDRPCRRSLDVESAASRLDSAGSQSTPTSTAAAGAATVVRRHSVPSSSGCPTRCSSIPESPDEELAAVDPVTGASCSSSRRNAEQTDATSLPNSSSCRLHVDELLDHDSTLIRSGIFAAAADKSALDNDDVVDYGSFLSGLAEDVTLTATTSSSCHACPDPVAAAAVDRRSTASTHSGTSDRHKKLKERSGRIVRTIRKRFSFPSSKKEYELDVRHSTRPINLTGSTSSGSAQTSSASFLSTSSSFLRHSLCLPLSVVSGDGAESPFRVASGALSSAAARDTAWNERPVPSSPSRNKTDDFKESKTERKLESFSRRRRHHPYHDHDHDHCFNEYTDQYKSGGTMEMDFEEMIATAVKKCSDSFQPVEEDQRAKNVAAVEVDYCDDELNTAQLDPQSGDVDYSSCDLQQQQHHHQPMFLDPDCNNIIEHHRLRRQRAVKARKAHGRSNRARSLNRDELASALCSASESLLGNTSQRSVSADDILSPGCSGSRITSTGGRSDCAYNTDDELQLSPSDRTSSRSDTSTCVSVESEPARAGGGHDTLKVSRSNGSRGSYEGQLSLLGCRAGGGGELAGGMNSYLLTSRRKTCFELKDRLIERCDGKQKSDFERKFSMQVEYFTLNFDVSGAEKTTMIASADRGVTLGQAIADPLKDLGLNVDRVAVFLESSHSALPLNSDCFRLAGSTLHVRAKDEDRRDSASSAAAAAAAAAVMTCNSTSVNSLNRDRRQSAMYVKRSERLSAASTVPPYHHHQNSSNHLHHQVVNQAVHGGGCGNGGHAQCSTPSVSATSTNAVAQQAPVVQHIRAASQRAAARTSNGVCTSTGGCSGVVRDEPHPLAAGPAVLASLIARYDEDDLTDSEGVKLKKTASPCDDGGGSGNGNSGGSIGTGDVSPCGTLSRVGAINTSDIQKYRATVSTRPHNKLQSLFSTFGKTQDKQEQLNELLTGYSLNGLPRMPDLLTLGRPHYDPSAFHLERHWTDIVDNTDSLNKRQRDQQEAIWELLTTEVEYIQKLRATIDVFMCCLFDLQNEQILNEVDSDKLFSNICDVYYATCHFWVNHMSQVLRQARETRELLDPCLLKAGFLVFDKIFQSYTKYCLEQETCREYIKTNTKDNDFFGTFIRWGETQKQCNRLKLVDLIVKPWQRLMKYKLLLYAIRKPLDKMDPSADVEEQRNDITEMMEQVEKFVHHVNMELRQRHEYKQLALIIDRIESYDAVDMPSEECVKLVSDFCKIDLTCPVPGCGQQESRVLLLEGNLKLKDTYSKTDVYCFLFTDMLLITKPAAKRGDKVKIIKPPMRLDKIIVYSLRDATSFMLLYLNEYHMAQAVYTLHGDSKLWLEGVTKAQNEYKEKRNRHLVRNESMLLDVYDDVDDDFGLQTQSDLLTTGRHESDSVADSFLPNCPTPVYRSISCADSIASSFADSALHSEMSLSRPHSATALTQHDSVLSRHSSSSSTSDHLRVPKQSYGSEAFSAAPGEPRLKMAHRTLRYGDRAETNQTGDEVGCDENVDSVRTRLNQRRALRTERRYHTADTIRDLRHSRDNSIHKRLSLNYSSSAATSAVGARMDSDSCSRLEPTSAYSCESVHSIPSSSGVSSTASLCRTGDISEETTDDVASVTTTSELVRKTSDIGATDRVSLTGRTDVDNDAVPAKSLLSPSLFSDGNGTNSMERPLSNSLSDENHRLQLMIAERRRMNQELLLLDPHLEASEV